MGLYDQTIWKYSQFLSPYNTIKERFILGDHLNLTLPLLAPLFYIWDDVRILLIFQAFWISFSTIAIYKLCLKRGFTRLTSLSLSFVYSLFYGIQFAIFFDFHPVVIGVGLLAWLVYFLESRKKTLLFLTIALSLLTQENMGIALAGLGLIYLFKKEYREISVIFIIGGIISSLVSAKIVEFFSPIGFQYSPQITLDPIKNIVGFFDSPEKRQTWLYSLSWFGFLPVFSIGSLLAVFLDLSQYFISGPEFTRMWSPFMHHRAILAPFLLLGTLDALIFLKKKVNPEKLSVFLLFIALSLQLYFHYPLNKLSKSVYWKSESWMEDNQKLFKLIPKQASIATQQDLIPHLSHRKEIYLVWPKKHEDKWLLDFGGKPEYLVVDLHPNQWLTQLLETNENFGAAVKNMESSGRISLEKEVNFAKFYRINYKENKTD